jgi:hypothetical protein
VSIECHRCPQGDFITGDTTPATPNAIIHTEIILVSDLILVATDSQYETATGLTLYVIRGNRDSQPYRETSSNNVQRKPKYPIQINYTEMMNLFISYITHIL